MGFQPVRTIATLKHGGGHVMLWYFLALGGPLALQKVGGLKKKHL